MEFLGLGFLAIFVAYGVVPFLREAFRQTETRVESRKEAANRSPEVQATIRKEKMTNLVSEDIEGDLRSTLYTMEEILTRNEPQINYLEKQGFIDEDILEQIGIEEGYEGGRWTDKDGPERFKRRKRIAIVNKIKEDLLAQGEMAYVRGQD